MKNKSASNFQFSIYTVLLPIVFVLMMWLVYWVEVRFHVSLNKYGLQPKKLIGLRGIFFSPFLHGSLKHLFSNTLPMLILFSGLKYFYTQLSNKVFIIGFILSGVFTWLLGEKGSLHIGASGMVYFLTSFLFFMGIWSRHYRMIALSLAVVFVYGSLIWGVFPGEEGISWEGHLAGFIAGFIIAFVYRKNTIEKESFEWQKETYQEEEDDFLKHFDENGNFIPSSELEKRQLLDREVFDEIEIKYHFKDDKQNL
ncbi:rhomboid family intramembrane serine protease [Mesonia sp. K7]|uniref:rhomboid family intramembrane serine protease n=1 Tax=Mesonia sp. K7 TaxID=2218606 RepID=UPI000DA9004D|nr:rhomboid family intramembrane serine protease [Mesonia sp. K7]PZD77532.1 rhomboid family intramembrane serine protease [Mesonia sp. K7]